MRIVFFGTPEFAVPALDAVAREHEVVLVVAQPDKPAGRGMKMQAPAVAVRAREFGLPLVQPAKIRNAEFLDSHPRAGARLRRGHRVRKDPAGGAAGDPAARLPQRARLRTAAVARCGADPASIEAGDRVTGVTIMRVDEELDHGPMLAIETLEIEPDERTPGLLARPSALGAEALLTVLRSSRRHGRGDAAGPRAGHHRAEDRRGEKVL